MHVDAVTAPGPALLGALRDVLSSSDDALLCVAFAQARGVHLIARELTDLSRRGRARVLVTTVFGTATDVALGALRDTGASVRVLNPPGRTYLAWDVLRSRGKLTNREMLDELRIHRSSNASAILSRLPGVTVTSARPIELAYRPSS